jgi:hypothetical protein
MAQAVKAFQQHAENFLVELKRRLFDGKVTSPVVGLTVRERRQTSIGLLVDVARERKSHRFRRIVQHVRGLVRESARPRTEKVENERTRRRSAHPFV